MFKPKSIQGIYLTLIMVNTLAASFIWGINTIFLLSAGLSNFQAFLANAFFTLGQVIFEVPTGIVADTYGRRISYLLGCVSLFVSTILYLWMWEIKGPFWGWAASSMLLGFGFTFFSGALEAWLVDALKETKYAGSLDSVFAKGQIVAGVAMLVGSISGGIIAQVTNLGVPYLLRSGVLVINFFIALFLMKDLGFKASRPKQPIGEMKKILDKSITFGFKNPPVRFMMLAAPFIFGVSFYVFYALQPYLLNLYGDSKAYSIAGLVAAIAALAQIAGGFAAPRIRKLFKKRTTAIFAGIFISSFMLIAVSLVANFWLALLFIFIWGLIFAGLNPIRQAYLNGNIPSEQRATVLSFDSLMGSSGGIVIQPILGKAADVYGYAISYFISSFFQLAALPFVYLAYKQKSPGDEAK